MKHFAVYHDFVNIYTVLNIFHIDSNNIDNNFVCTPMFPTLVNQKSFPTFQILIKTVLQNLPGINFTFANATDITSLLKD